MIWHFRAWETGRLVGAYCSGNMVWWQWQHNFKVSSNLTGDLCWAGPPPLSGRTWVYGDPSISKSRWKLLAIWKLVNRDNLLSVANLFGMGQTTTGVTAQEVCLTIQQVLAPYLTFPYQLMRGNRVDSWTALKLLMEPTSPSCALTTAHQTILTTKDYFLSCCRSSWTTGIGSHPSMLAGGSRQIISEYSATPAYGASWSGECLPTGASSLKMRGNNKVGGPLTIRLSVLLLTHEAVYRCEEGLQIPLQHDYVLYIWASGICLDIDECYLLGFVATICVLLNILRSKERSIILGWRN